MPRWFSSGRQCPLTAEQQEWIDRRWDWLRSQFGDHFPRDRPVVLPTAEFFPDTSTQTPAGIDALFRCVCRYMLVDPATVTLTLFDAPSVPITGGTSPDGLYSELAEGHFGIAIATRTLADPFNFVGTVAHELAHVHLLGHKRLTGDTADHELVTDLLPIFFGAGIFGANSVIYEKSELGYWSAGTRGYMGMAMHSYAMAKLARARGEVRPPWARHLRRDVRAEFREFSRVLAGRSAITEETDDESRPAVASPEAGEEDSSEVVPPMEPEELLARYAAGERVFRETDFADIALAGLDLRNCDFSDSDFSGALLDGANLSGCRMVGTILRWASLGNADLTACDLREADLTAANLSGADLSRSDLRDADFRAAALTGTNFTDTRRSTATDFREADVSTAVGAPELAAEAKRTGDETDGHGPSDRFANALLSTMFVTMFAVVAFQLIAIQTRMSDEARQTGTMLVLILVLAYQIVKRRWR